METKATDGLHFPSGQSVNYLRGSSAASRCARRFQNVRVISENQMKKRMKDKKSVWNIDEAENMLFTIEKAVNIRVPRPEKQAVIWRTSFIVIG